MTLHTLLSVKWSFIGDSFAVFVSCTIGGDAAVLTLPCRRVGGFSLRGQGPITHSWSPHQWYTVPESACITRILPVWWIDYERELSRSVRVSSMRAPCWRKYSSYVNLRDS